MDPTHMTYNSGPLWLLILIFVYTMLKKWCSKGEE